MDSPTFPIPDRARGALVGLAVGDALGTTLEFSTPEAPPFPTLARGPHVDVTGGGPFHVLAGQVTDDTQMACALADSTQAQGLFDVKHAAQGYREWMRHAFDIGSQTRAALSRLRPDEDDPIAIGRQVWLERQREAAGNGSLMRTAPIGVWFTNDPTARRRASLDDSAITHYDPRCRLACAAFNTAIATALTRENFTPEDLIGAAEQEVDQAGQQSAAEIPEESDRVIQAATDLSDDLAASRRDDPDLYSDQLHLHRHQGFVRVAFRLAFWELLHAPSFEAALVDAVNRGGDADTNGAITGALLGAYHGAEAIPERWKTPVLTVQLPGPMGERYHPAKLLQAFGL